MVEPEELVWLARNLKLEVTKYSKQIYGPLKYAYPSDDDNDDGDDREMTSSYWPRKRHY